MLKAKEKINANLEKRSRLPAMHVASKNSGAILTLTSPNRVQRCRKQNIDYVVLGEILFFFSGIYLGSSVIALWVDKHAKGSEGRASDLIAITSFLPLPPRSTLLCSRQQPLAGLRLGCGRRCGTGIFVDKLPFS